ncbi:MAG TPA: hypothetical protein PLC99_13500 [Verrucomicrobiota bacterium]|nr:hypothetical protein [Verrucomicrobiota bacterium]
MTSKITRVYCRENQFSIAAAQKLKIPGVAEYVGKENALALTHELVVEWGQPTTKQVQWVGPDGQALGVQLIRCGRLAWIRLVVNVYSDQHSLNVNIYSVALMSSLESLHAQHSFEYVGLPSSVTDEFPKPSDWAEFNEQSYDAAYEKIRKAQEKFAEIPATYVPSETQMPLGVIPYPEYRFVRSAKYAIDGLSFSAAGRVLWDVRYQAKNRDLDPDVCTRVYGLFGVTNEYLLPGGDTSDKADDWKNWIENGA